MKTAVVETDKHHQTPYEDDVAEGGNEEEKRQLQTDRNDVRKI
jgi:hypothetical protein